MTTVYGFQGPAKVEFEQLSGQKNVRTPGLRVGIYSLVGWGHRAK